MRIQIPPAMATGAMTFAIPSKNDKVLSVIFSAVFRSSRFFNFYIPVTRHPHRARGEVACFLESIPPLSAFQLEPTNLPTIPWSQVPIMMVFALTTVAFPG